MEEHSISNQLVESIRSILKEMGEDPDREGLSKTPLRYLKALKHLTSGYEQSVQNVVNGALFELPEVSSSEMILVKDIEMYSVCEHHLLPFYGKLHVAYLPQGRIIGLSKIPRLVEVFARRLQVQERLTAQVASSLMETVGAHGVGVVCEAYHLCMMMRGVQKQSAYAKTSCLLGNFQEPELRNEFFSLVK